MKYKTYRIPNFFGLESSDVDDAKEEYDFKEVNKVIETQDLYAVRSEGELRSVDEDFRRASDTDHTLREDLDTLNNVKDIVEDVEITDTTSTLIETVVESIYRRHGLKYRRPSIEKYNSRNSLKNLNIAIEGIGDFIAKMWDSFWKFIKGLFGFGKDSDSSAVGQVVLKYKKTMSDLSVAFKMAIEKGAFKTDIPEEEYKKMTLRQVKDINTFFAGDKGGDLVLEFNDVIDKINDSITFMGVLDKEILPLIAFKDNKRSALLSCQSLKDLMSSDDPEISEDLLDTVIKEFTQNLKLDEYKNLISVFLDEEPENIPTSVCIGKCFSEDEAKKVMSLLDDKLDTSIRSIRMTTSRNVSEDPLSSLGSLMLSMSSDSDYKESSYTDMMEGKKEHETLGSPDSAKKKKYGFLLKLVSSIAKRTLKVLHIVLYGQIYFAANIVRQCSNASLESYVSTPRIVDYSFEDYPPFIIPEGRVISNENFIVDLWKRFWKWLKGLFGFGGGSSGTDMKKSISIIRSSFDDMYKTFNKSIDNPNEHPFTEDINENDYHDLTRGDNQNAVPFSGFGRIEGTTAYLDFSSIIEAITFNSDANRKFIDLVDIKKVTNLVSVKDAIEKYKDSPDTLFSSNDELKSLKQDIFKEMGLDISKSYIGEVSNSKNSINDSFPITDVCIDKPLSKGEAKQIMDLLNSNYKKSYDDLLKLDNLNFDKSMFSNYSDPQEATFLLKLLQNLCYHIRSSIGCSLYVLKYLPYVILKQFNNVSVESFLNIRTSNIQRRRRRK